MKKNITILAIIILVALLQSCSSDDKSTSDKVSADQIYTSVAGSLTAQAASQPTATVAPPATATVAPTKEQLIIPTLAQVAPTQVSNPVGCDNAAFVNDVTIADGTAVSPGKTFTKTWRVQNSGSCDWNSSYQLVFSTGEAMNGVSTYVPFTIPVGKQVDLSVNLTAPTTLGTYKGYWKLKNPGGATFGQNLYVEINVTNSTSTPIPTSAATSTLTSTTLPPTATLTQPVVPTNTPTTASS